VLFLLQAGLIAGLVLNRIRRRRVESELRANQQLMELATSAGRLGLWSRDLSGDDVWVNSVLRTHLGLGRDDTLRAGDLLARIHPDDRVRVIAEVRRAQESNALFEGEFRSQLPDGRERWVLAKGGTVNVPGGRGVRRMGAVLDITERKKMEEELRESEARFRMMADTAPVMIWMSGLDRLCIFFNSGWLDFTGRTIEQELGDGWTEGIHREDLNRCLAVYVTAFDARQEFAMEYRLRRSDGEYCWVLDHGVPRFETDGTFLGYIGTAVDISEIKRGDERFRLAVEASANAIVMVNDQGRIVLVNQKTETFFGYSRDELIGQSVEMFVPERLRGSHPDHRGRFIALPEKRPMGAGRELYARRKDGSEVLVEIGLNPIHTQDGLLVLTSIVDISARKEAEDALEKEHRFLRQVIDIDPNFIFAKDRDGRFTLVNQAVADAYGTTVEALIGKTDADFNPNRDEVEHFHRMDLEVIDNLQERFVPEEHLTDARGEIRWLQTVKRPIGGKNGVADQVLGASTDITRRKLMEIELQRQREDLAHVTRVSLMGELTASLAHELNQPLTAILSNAQAAQRFLMNQAFNLDEVRDILKDIVEDNNRAAEIIRKIRALVRKEQLTFARLDLPAVIRDVLSLVRSDADLRNVQVDYQPGDRVPSVRGDRIQLQQVLLNLLLNAFDAMQECRTDQRRLSVRVHSDGVGLVDVAVRDGGIGLTNDKLDRIFEPFFTTKKEGLGMGLSISRSIVEAHGGHLWAENNQDRGATFHLVLPVFADAEKIPVSPT
jgi:PAS domain S-box-containing protein